MNILISTLMFNGYTGSEWYNYELCRNLALMKNSKNKKLNCVTLLSNINPCSSLNTKLQKLGVKVLDFKRVSEIPNDIQIVHFSHKSVGEFLLKLSNLKNAKFFTTIHSEIINLEEPVISDRIKNISIRPKFRIKFRMHL